MFCPKCGTQNDNDSTFCQECGAALIVTKPVSSVAKKSKKKILSLIMGLVMVSCIGTAAYFLFANQMSRSSELFFIAQNGKYGYINKSGNIVITPQYDGALSFGDGLAAVKIGNKWGYIDKSGKIIINPQYDGTLSFGDGLAAVKIGNKWGYIDKSGKIIINPQYDEAHEFNDGLAVIKQGEKRGYIDKDGNIVITPQYDGAQRFSENIAAVFVGGKWGYINKSGKIIIDPQFIIANEFHEGLAGVAADLLNKHYVIDKTGKIVINLQTSAMYGYFQEGLAAVLFGGPGFGYIDKTGKTVINSQFALAKYFQEGMAAVMLGGKWGYIDKTGKFVINPQYDSANSFRDGLALVKIGNKSGYIDKTGKFVWPAEEQKAEGKGFFSNILNIFKKGSSGVATLTEKLPGITDLGSNNKELSRSVALTMLQKEKSYVSIILAEGVAQWHNESFSNLRKLESAGYIRLTEAPVPKGIIALRTSRYDVTILDSLNPYILSRESGGGGRLIRIKLYDIVADEITGITSAPMDPSAKIVQYKVKAMPTPLANLGLTFEKTGQKKEALFRKYDDGWRLEN